MFTPTGCPAITSGSTKFSKLLLLREYAARSFSPSASALFPAVVGVSHVNLPQDFLGQCPLRWPLPQLFSIPRRLVPLPAKMLPHDAYEFWNGFFDSVNVGPGHNAGARGRDRRLG